MSTILVILLILLLVGGFGWHHTGYVGGPYLGGGIGTVIVLLLVLMVLRII